MRDHSLAAQLKTGREVHRGGYVRRLAESALLAKLDAALCEGGGGSLRITLPSGATAILGRPGKSCDAHLVLRRYTALWKLMRGGALGLAESYMDGDIETDDLRALFELYYANEGALNHAIPSLRASRGRDRLWHFLRRNTKSGSKRNIAAHYDLGNAFYRLWLDEGMQYSSGIFDSGAFTLEDAQKRKLDRILDALELAPHHRLLEIGCGWGGLAEAAARRVARVDAITISQQQLQEARSRVARSGAEDRVDVRFEDYRDTGGTYDRLVSIEMIEAVGEDNWPRYFSTIADRLGSGGVAVLQAITIDEDAFDGYRQNPDFIQRYIFPGGMLPTIGLMRDRAEAAGLVFETVERFGASYARTLAEWRLRFEAAWPSIEALGFDQRFRRMWIYYLIYCEVGFERGLIDVGLYRLRKPAAATADPARPART